MVRGSIVASVFAQAAAVTSLMGCTLVSSFEVRECQRDTDCTLPMESVGHCERSVCESGCRDNHQCLSIDPRYPICSQVGGECVGLTNGTGECYVGSDYVDDTMGGFTADQMTLVGAFMPRVRSSEWLTVQLAAAEITSTGLLAQSPLLAIVCSDALENVAVGMAHLDRLGVTALLAPADEAALAALASLPSAAQGKVFLSPGGASPAPVETTRDAVWYLGASYADVIQAYPPMIAALVASAGGAPLKIATVTGTAVEDVRIAERVYDVIQVNGVNATRLEIEDRLRPFQLADVPEQRARVTAEIAAYAPDIVLWFAGGKFADPAHEERAAAVQQIEVRLSTGTDRKPTYLFGPRNTEDASLRSLASRDESFRSRAVGLRADRAGEPEVMAGLFERFRASFPSAAAQPRPLYPAPGVYDAFHSLTYGLAVTRASQSDLRDIFARAGDRAALVPVGPAGLEQAAQLLSGATPFGVAGTSGPLTFDPEGQARRANVRAYCWSDGVQITDVAEYESVRGSFARVSDACSGGAFDAGN
jgi:hypothetical protein